MSSDDKGCFVFLLILLLFFTICMGMLIVNKHYDYISERSECQQCQCIQKALESKE